MYNAKIIENKPCCERCKIELRDESADVDIVRVNDEIFFQFIRRCNTCKELSKYLVDNQFEKRYTVNQLEKIDKIQKV